MTRISIQTSTLDGKQHVTVYLSDGITITERAGTKIIRTIIRTYVAHRRDQYRLSKAIKHAGKSFTQKFTSALDPTKSSARIQRFKIRVDGNSASIERTVTQ